MNDIFTALTAGLNIDAGAIESHQDAIDDICGQIDDNEFGMAISLIARTDIDMDGASEIMDCVNLVRDPLVRANLITALNARI